MFLIIFIGHKLSMFFLINDFTDLIINHIYIYMYIHIHMYTYVYIHMYVYMYMYIYMYKS